MSTARKAAIISAAVLTSRMFGLVREIVFAALFGAGAVSDAFKVAFRIPNMLRDLFAEGALSTAFVTTFSKSLERDGTEPAFRLANVVFSLQLVAIGVLALLGVIFAGPIVALLTGNTDPFTTELATGLARVMFPFILFVSLSATVMGLLNALNCFAVPASATIFFNIGTIVCGVAFAWWIDPQFQGDAIYGMAGGVLVGGLLQLAVQLPAAWSRGFRFRWDWDWNHPGLSDVLRLLGPALLSGGAVQINVLINTRFAQELGVGPVSWLQYALIITLFPVGMFGVAVATVTLPTVSKNAATEDWAGFRTNLSRSLRLTAVLTIPAAAGLYVVAYPVIELALERGRFFPTDTANTALALKAFALSVAGYSLNKVLIPPFSALDQPQTPLRISLIGIGINLAMNFTFAKILHWPFWWLAVSTSVVTLLNFVQLWLAMRARVGSLEEGRFLSTVARTLGAAGVMALCVEWLLHQWLGRELPLATRIAALAGTILVGVSVFGALAWILRVPEATELGQRLGARAARMIGINRTRR